MPMFKLLAITWAASTLGLDCQGEDCEGSSLAQLQVQRAGIPKTCHHQGHDFTCDSCQGCAAGQCIGLTCDEKCQMSCSHGYCVAGTCHAPACANWPDCGDRDSCNGCKKTVNTKGTRVDDGRLNGDNSCSNSTFELATGSRLGPYIYCVNGACRQSSFTKLTHMVCDTVSGPDNPDTCGGSSMAFFSPQFKVPLTLLCGIRSCRGVSVTASNNLRLVVFLNPAGDVPKSIEMSEGCLVLKCTWDKCDHRVLDQIDLKLGSKASCAAVNYGDDKLPTACRDKKAVSCGTDLMA